MKLNISSRLRAIWAGVFILVAYGVLASSITQTPIVILIADVISGLAVISIAILMYPLFWESSKFWSRIYIVLRFIEGFIMVVAGFIFLFSPDTRGLIYDKIQVWPFILGAFVFYYLLYISKLIPRFISIWGILGTAVLALSSLLQIFGQSSQILEYFLVLIITNEIFLAGWLIFRGINTKVAEKI